LLAFCSRYCPCTHLKKWVYKAAVSELYLVQSLDCWGILKFIKKLTVLPATLKMLLIARVTGAQGSYHRSATVSLYNPHTAGAITLGTD